MSHIQTTEGNLVGGATPLPIQGGSLVSTQPIPVTQAPKASYQTMKTFTGTITTSTTVTIVQNLYTVTSGKTFYLTDVSFTNATANTCLSSVNASQTIGASPVDMGHTTNTAPYIKSNIGTEPSVAGSVPMTVQVGLTTAATTIAFTVSGYEQ